MRRHPGAVGVRAPPTHPLPWRGRDRRAAPAGALWRLRSHPGPAARRAAATPGRRHRGDRHRTGSQGPGMGHRRIAAALGRSPSTVRRWLRRARGRGHLTRLWQRGAQELIRLDADTFNQLAGTGNCCATPSPFSPPRPGGRATGWASTNPCGPSSACTPAAGFSPRRADPLAARSSGRARGLARPTPPVTMTTNIRRHGVTVNTIASACTPTTAVRPHRKRRCHGHFECRATVVRHRALRVVPAWSPALTFAVR